MSPLTSIFTMARAIGLKDLIDILCVTFVFFSVFKLFQVSRSFLALRSLVTLLVGSFGIYFIAQALDLTALSLVFGRFWTVVVILFLIVFQSELRRAFQEIGRIRYVRVLIRPTAGEAEALASALVRLSEKKLGALIIFERKQPVLPLVPDQGREIDAIISEDLLVALFFSYNPLHDGAALVVGNRIARSKIMLPLSTKAKSRDNIPRHLGTRHRAAIEITETTDAVAAVVSEETGTISIVVDGMMERGLTLEPLREHMTAILEGRPLSMEER